MMRYENLGQAVERNRPRDITLRHPMHGETTVKAARDKLDAVTEAARRWGAQWSVIAAECEFEEKTL